MKNNKVIKLFLGITLILLASQNIQASPLFHSVTPNEQRILNQAPNLNPTVLNLGLKAYYHARQKGLEEKDILTIIDYSKPSSVKRLWVINLHNDKVLFDTYVAHGKGSGNKYATHFSNQSHSLESSIGVYLTGKTYTGKHGYSLRLRGLENGFNSNAYQRSIVMHSAWYVSKSFLKEYGRMGRSWGCPAISQKMAPAIIKTIKKGTILMAYYPNKNWINHSQFV